VRKGFKIEIAAQSYEPCSFVAVSSSECPSDPDLGECFSYMGTNLLCEADRTLPDGKTDYNIDNCNGYDVFKCTRANPNGSNLRFGQQVLDNTVENMPETVPDPLQYEGKPKESNLRFGQQGQDNTGENIQDPFPDPLEHEQIA